MIKIRDKWCMMIALNNVCPHKCTYCVKYIRHVRPDQQWQMSLDEFKVALDSLEGWKNGIALTGGEPMNNPNIVDMCYELQKRFPKRQLKIFTSSKKVNDILGVINNTFGEVYINDHSKEQQEVCKHQPNTIALDEIVADPSMRKALRENCWLNATWSPVITNKGCFMCDNAEGIDTVLDMNGGWPIEKGWWMRDSYEDQMEKYCGLCGVCVPWETQVQANKTELFTPKLLETFKEHKLLALDNVKVVNDVMTNEQVMEKAKTWTPWRNREDKPAEGPAYVNH